MSLQLTSSAFKAGDMIPGRHTCNGANVSPPLTWTGAPGETQSFVVICDDPDAPNGTFTHWVLYNLSALTTQLAEGYPAGEQPAAGGLHGRNSFGNAQYEGPCPPAGPAHHYHFRLFALNEPLDLSPGATRQQVLDQMQNHILDRTELIGLYARS